MEVLKKIFGAITSTKGIILASVSLIMVVNELRLKVAVHEISNNTEQVAKDSYNEIRNDNLLKHKKDSLAFVQLIQSISLSEGLIVDYTAIRQSTYNAVKDGYIDAIEYSKMYLSNEISNYDTVYLKTGQEGRYYRLIRDLFTDNIYSMDTVDKIPEGKKSL